eukprot:969665-Pleurochrysis_carterae.AAC.2
MDVEKASGGSILLHVRDTARKVAEEANRNDMQQRMCVGRESCSIVAVCTDVIVWCYWGYRFEQLCTGSGEESSGVEDGGPEAQSADVASPSDPKSFGRLCYSAGEMSELQRKYGAPSGSSGDGEAHTATISGGSGGRGGSGAVNANEEFVSVMSIGIDELKILMAAEIDCTQPGSGYVELKTNKLLQTERDRTSFEKHKLLKFWLQVHASATASAIVSCLLVAATGLPARTDIRSSLAVPIVSLQVVWTNGFALVCVQSFLAGVPKIVVGFRDAQGAVHELTPLETLKIPRMVREKRLWDPSVCLNFGKTVLQWIIQQISSILSVRRFRLRYDPGRREITLSPMNSN